MLKIYYVEYTHMNVYYVEHTHTHTYKDWALYMKIISWHLINKVRNLLLDKLKFKKEKEKSTNFNILYMTKHTLYLSVCFGYFLDKSREYIYPSKILKYRKI